MRPVSFVICAAGSGARFRENGLDISKPLIRLNGKSMLERSIEALELQPSDQLIVICQRKDHLPSHFGLSPRIEWLELDQPTGGQLETYLKAANLVAHEDIVIFNCDTFFTCPDLRLLIDSGKYQGIIPCSIQPGTSWSFCKIDDDDNVTEVAEKKRISDWASVGYYYFHGKERLHELAQKECLKAKVSESYVAPLYNEFLLAGLKIKLARVEQFLPFGTIDQVEKYWGISFAELIRQNT